jgi:hypothetical protein
MAKRKKAKRRSPKKKAQRAKQPADTEELEATEEAGGSPDEASSDEDVVEARFDDEGDADGEDGADEAAAAPAGKPARKESKPAKGERPVGPGVPEGYTRVSTGGGLWVMAVVFGLILVAVVVQFLLE